MQNQPRIRDINKPLHSSAAVFYGVLKLKDAIDLYNMNIDVDFQRGHVWNRKQQELFVGHVLEGGEVPSLILNLGPRDKFQKECQLIDGKQRITACMLWAAGEIDAELYDGTKINAKFLDEVDRRICSMSIGLRFATVHLTRKECLEVYLKLNRGGTIHSDEEIDKVRKLLENEK
jgi:hypothetical protein